MAQYNTQNKLLGQPGTRYEVVMLADAEDKLAAWANAAESLEGLGA